MTAAGENKSLTDAEDLKMRKTLLTAWGIRETLKNLYWGVKTWETSAGEMRLRTFNLLGNKFVGKCSLFWLRRG